MLTAQLLVVVIVVVLGVPLLLNALPSPLGFTFITHVSTNYKTFMEQYSGPGLPTPSSSSRPPADTILIMSSFITFPSPPPPPPPLPSSIVTYISLPTVLLLPHSCFGAVAL